MNNLVFLAEFTRELTSSVSDVSLTTWTKSNAMLRGYCTLGKLRSEPMTQFTLSNHSINSFSSLDTKNADNPGNEGFSVVQNWIVLFALMLKELHGGF